MAELAAIGATIATAASSIPAWVPAAASAASAAVGAGATYASNKAQGQMAKATSEFNAKELERAAGDEHANAVRRAQQQREQADRVMSQQRAVAASSGAGTSEGEGYLDVVGDTAQRGQYYSDLEISSGDNRAAGLIGKAAATRWKGTAEKGSYDTAANAALVKGAFDVASVGLKNRNRFGGTSSSDDLVDFDPESGWETRTRRTRGRYF